MSGIDSHSHSAALGAAFFLNLTFCVIEIVGGLLTNSMAIISDSIHGFGDTLIIALSWYFQRISERGRTRKYTYGYRRFSLIGCLINAAVLIVACVLIVAEALPRLARPEHADARGMFVLAGLGIVIQGAAVVRTWRTRSVNERLVSLHLLSDVLGWTAVLAGSVAIYFTGLEIIDPLLSLAIVCFILVNVIRNLRRAAPVLLQAVPAEIDVERVADRLRALWPVAGVHDLHIWSLDEEYAVATVHILLNEAIGIQKMSELKGQIRADLRTEGIQHATIEFDVVGNKCELEDCVR
jgi:cobalt-zinc-cadmium efflux system protein